MQKFSFHSLPVSKTEISCDSCAISMKAREEKSKSSPRHWWVLFWSRWYLLGLSPLKLSAEWVYFSWVPQSTQTFTPPQRSASLLKGLSMQMVKYATHSKFSLSAFAQLAKTQGDFSSNIISDRCIFSQYISVHMKTSPSFGKVNYFLCFNYFHDHSQLFTFHSLIGKRTLCKHFLSLQEPLNWLIATDPLRDLDILFLL